VSCTSVSGIPRKINDSWHKKIKLELTSPFLALVSLAGRNGYQWRTVDDELAHSIKKS
jgi:hypothetical protein